MPQVKTEWYGVQTGLVTMDFVQNLKSSMVTSSHFGFFINAKKCILKIYFVEWYISSHSDSQSTAEANWYDLKCTLNAK